MKHSTIIRCAVASIALVGCEHTDKILATQFAPNANGIFTFHGFAAVSYPISSPDGEATCLSILAE